MINQETSTYTAAILDMDGVVTQTALLHAEAWKEMFDAFLQARFGENYRPLIIEKDYRQYIDGIPRFDGVANFLKSRDIKIPEGEYGDEPHMETIYGLGNRKNEIFRALVAAKGAYVYEDALEMLEKWKKANIKLAIISSSRNCKYIIGSAGLTDLFDARVDGEIMAEEKLPGKPEPDIFLTACENLGVEPSAAIILEDSIAGIKAGKSGNFAQVIGVARHGDEKELKEAGADLIVEKLTELRI